MSEKRPTPKTVANGKIRRPKGDFGRNLIDIFFSEGIRGVAEDVTKNVVVPGIKNMLYNSLVRGANTAIFGKDAVNPGVRVTSGESRVFISYDGLSKNVLQQTPQKPQEPKTENSYSGLVNEIIFSSQEEAVKARNEVIDRLEDYDILSVKDLCIISGVKSDWAKDSYGWHIQNLTDKDIQLIEIPGGWLLKLPKPRPIE